MIHVLTLLLAMAAARRMIEFTSTPYLARYGASLREGTCEVELIPSARYSCLNGHSNFLEINKPPSEPFDDFCTLQCLLHGPGEDDLFGYGCFGWTYASGTCKLRQCVPGFQDDGARVTTVDANSDSRVGLMRGDCALLRTSFKPVVNKLPNVLLIIADDMSPMVRPWVSQKHVMNKKTPNLDEFVKESVTFVNAHANIAVCGPSRQSFMSGRLPDSTQIWSFERVLMESTGSTTLGKLLKEQLGYHTAAFGKVYHEHESNSGFKDLWFDEGHWSQPEQAHDSNGNIECGTRWHCTDFSGDDLTDSRIAKAAVAFIEHRAKFFRRLPWFAAVGFRRPHISQAVPRSVLADIPMTEVDYPDTSEPFGSFRTSFSRFECKHEITNRLIRVGTNWREFLDPVANRAYTWELVDARNKYESTIKQMRRSYYAAISWMDTRLGVVLASLENEGFRDDTIVIFTGDHGFAQGEHGTFCKNALFDQVTRVPLVVRVPKLVRRVFFIYGALARHEMTGVWS